MSENNRSYCLLLFCIVFSLIALVSSAAAQSSAQPDPASYGMTSGRLIASSSVLLALIGVVIGCLALFRPTGRFGTASGSLGAVIAIATGLVGAVVGGIRVVSSPGGIGTGNGLAGAIVAVVLGVMAVALGGLALSRSRRTATTLR
jgi:hypothetical protein